MWSDIELVRGDQQIACDFERICLSLAFRACLGHNLRMPNADLTARTLEISRSLGFDLCGVAPAADFPELSRFDEWLERGFAGEMHYLQDSRRRSPTLAMRNARSVIACALNYNTAFPASTDPPAPAHPAAPAGGPQAGPQGWISRYAWGDDYHKVLGEKLGVLIERLHIETREAFEARAYVDTGPIAERVVAKHAGLGWLAKNTCLIHEKLGSWLFLGVIVTTLDLAASLGPAEPPAPDLCGNCSLCIDACPTGAIVEPYILDARKCISYLTIELKGAIPRELRDSVGRHVFGCDICQDVCPWNRRAPVTTLPNFEPRRRDEHSLFSPDLEWLLSFSEEEFREVFRGSPVKRAKWRGLLRNACVAVGNCGLRAGEPRYTEICERLSRLAGSDDSMLAEHAQWALERLGFFSRLPQPTDARVVPPRGQR
jgi:epoxyqueuosine reductase